MNTAQSQKPAAFKGNGRIRRRGFSLVEMLVVIAIIIALMGFAMIPMMGLKRSGDINQALERMSSELALAQQAAITENSVHEVRFYRYADPEMPGQEEAYRAFQIMTVAFEADPGHAAYVSPATSNFTPAVVPLTKVIFLPKGVVLLESSQYSPLLTDSSRIPSDPQTELLNSIPATYARMYFKPGGGTDLDLGQTWFLTLTNEQAATTSDELPPNYATLQIDPYTGKVNWYRP